MSKSGGDGRPVGVPGPAVRTRVGLIGVALAFALGQAAHAAIAGASSTRFELTPQTLQALNRAQEQSVEWLVQTDPDRAAARVSDLLEVARQLGMSRLPDLARAAVVRAVDRARHDDFDLAHQALAAAERLDPGRPEISFAAAAVSRREGRYPSAVGLVFQGFARTLRSPFERALLLEGGLVWLLWLLIAAAALFVAVQLAAKGGALLRDLVGLFGDRIPLPVGLALGVVLLLWPIALPSGVPLVLLYWSVLLFGYGSGSERAVLAAGWLLVAVAPLAIADQRGRLEVDLAPPALALDHLERGALYGDLFNDVGTLCALLPESVAVRQLVGDLHRRLGQWDLARESYLSVGKKEPANSAVLIDLGAYYVYRRDYAQAIEQFKRAADVDPSSAAAWYNLSGSYRESYRFEEAERADQRARAIDPARVESWVQRSERVVAIGGGFDRIGAIRRELASRLGSSPQSGSVRTSPWQVPVLLALAPLAAAVALHFVRRRRGYTETPLDLKLGSRAWHRWLRVLLPGLPSAEVGDGGRGYFAILLPLGLASLPFAGRLGYRIPWGYQPGTGVAWSVALVGLAVYFAARYRWDVENEV